MSVEPNLASTYNRAQKKRGVCFEVYGFDVLFDHKMKPWLLEVNILPSFSSSSPLDKKVKSMLMCDIFHLIVIQPYDKKKSQKTEIKKAKN